MHQLSPYIGKVKSTIASALIRKYSNPGQIIVDPFSGSGTIPLEAVLLQRNIIASDVSPYAYLLTKAKLAPPPTLQAALSEAETLLKQSEELSDPDLRTVPQWVRKFFHPRTLKEAIRFSHVCKGPGHEFVLACFLGILHHQRPGFLSYPSSHLVPYLRYKLFPKHIFPELYRYRQLRPRLLNKINRAYKRYLSAEKRGQYLCHQSPVELLQIQERFDCLITSPPYMNALDYGRDNRLRLWFLTHQEPALLDTQFTKSDPGFESAINTTARLIESNLNRNGHAIFVVGEDTVRGFHGHPSHTVRKLMKKLAPSMKLKEFMCDRIPDLRRSRRECSGIKAEHFLIYKRVK